MTKKLTCENALQVPVYTKECGARYCAAAKLVKAGDVGVGDRLYMSIGEHSTAQSVFAISKGTAHVKYVPYRCVYIYIYTYTYIYIYINNVRMYVCTYL